MALGKSFWNYKILIIYLCINYVFNHVQTYNMFTEYVCLPSNYVPF
jgi:hypothetical protein